MKENDYLKSKKIVFCLFFETFRAMHNLAAKTKIQKCPLLFSLSFDFKSESMVSFKIYAILAVGQYFFFLSNWMIFFFVVYGRENQKNLHPIGHSFTFGFLCFTGFQSTQNLELKFKYSFLKEKLNNKSHVGNLNKFTNVWGTDNLATQAKTGLVSFFQNFNVRLQGS